jgi:hypothetical protein
MAVRRRQTKADDGYARETFTQPREQARQTARAGLVSIAMAINNKAHFIEHPPFAGYGSGLLSWAANYRIRGVGQDWLAVLHRDQTKMLK